MHLIEGILSEDEEFKAGLFCLRVHNDGGRFNVFYILMCFIQGKVASTAVEYGLLVAFISLLILATVFSIGDDIRGFLTEIHDYIASV